MFSLRFVFTQGTFSQLDSVRAKLSLTCRKLVAGLYGCLPNRVEVLWLVSDYSQAAFPLSIDVLVTMRPADSDDLKPIAGCLGSLVEEVSGIPSSLVRIWFPLQGEVYMGDEAAN